MSISPAVDLSARVIRLERASRRDRLVALAVFALFFATAQAPANSPADSRPLVVRSASTVATLAADGLHVRDAAGNERVFAGVDSANRPSLDLHDSNGKLRESMYLLSDVPVLRLFDANDKRRAEFRLDGTGDGNLYLNDANEKARLRLYRTSNGDPQVGLYGSDEKLRAYFSTDDSSPYLVMRDASGTTRVYVGGYTDGKIGVDVRDASNTVLWKAP